MKIAIDVRSLMEGGVSGVERYTAEIVRAMVKIAPENEYHLFYNSARKVRLPDFGGHVTVHGFRYPNKVFKTTQRVFGFPKWNHLLPAIDVVFAPSLSLVPLSAGIPLVWVLHDLSYEHFPELFTLKQRLWHSLMMPRALARRADALIAVSEHTKQDAVRLYGIPEKKVQVIYSGVSLFTGPAFAEASAGKPAANLPTRFVLYLGTLEPRKNVDSLIRAYGAIAPDVEQDLVIAGAPGWSTGEIEQALRDSSHRERIHVLGFVSEEEKAALYAAADLFVYPSLYEGFGFPPLEALFSGTPVVTSFNSALPEVVGQWATLIDPYDVAGLALVLKELLHDVPAVPAEVQASIRQNYSWQAAARETLGVLERVA